jgi:6,7-dimethyl-8-ribityllumazine synthase
VGEYGGHEGGLDGRGVRVAVVAGRFNEHVTRPLLDGAVAALGELGVADDDVHVVWVPGAFEMPLVAKRLTASHDAVVCLGAVIRGETAHFDFVAGECAAGLRQVSLETGVPVVFGVLTTEDLDQAMARAGGARGNKGAEAATSAVGMVALLRSLAPGRPDDEVEAGTC